MNLQRSLAIAAAACSAAQADWVTERQAGVCCPEPVVPHSGPWREKACAKSNEGERTCWQVALS